MSPDQACNRQSAYCVPLYDTLGPDAVKYIVGHAAVTLVVADAVKMRALVEPLKVGLNRLSRVVHPAFKGVAAASSHEVGW